MRWKRSWWEAGRSIEPLFVKAPYPPIFEVPGEKIRKLVGFDFHRGWLACAKRPDWKSLEMLPSDPLSLALIGVGDLENVGSLLRTAGAFGIRNVLVDDQTADPYSRRVTRVSMGAALGQQFFRLSKPVEDLRALSKRGVDSLATTIDRDAMSISDCAPGNMPRVLVLGNEADGLPPAVQLAASKRVTIPMPGRDGPFGTESGDTVSQSESVSLVEDGAGGRKKGEPGSRIDGFEMVDSLNVAVAGAIAMYELSRASRQ